MTTIIHIDKASSSVRAALEHALEREAVTNSNWALEEFRIEVNDIEMGSPSLDTSRGEYCGAKLLWEVVDPIVSGRESLKEYLRYAEWATQQDRSGRGY